MFDPNENLVQRQHEQKVAKYVEGTIPQHALDLGTNVTVIQTTCNLRGCVPLETCIVIVFPESESKTQCIQGLKESCGGSYKTKILLPLREVGLEDVLDSLPPVFKGGRHTLERACFNLRDVMFERISGIVGNGNNSSSVEQRKILSQYLISSLEEYIQNGCIGPKPGMSFEDTSSNTSRENDFKDETSRSNKQSGNTPITSSLETRKKSNIITNYKGSQSMSRIIPQSSNSIIQRLSEREHTNCLRNASCPCCDNIDSIQNSLNNSMMLL